MPRLGALRRLVRDLKPRDGTIRDATSKSQDRSDKTRAGSGAGNPPAGAAIGTDEPATASGKGENRAFNGAGHPEPHSQHGNGLVESLRNHATPAPIKIGQVAADQPDAETLAHVREDERLAIREVAAQRRGRKYLREARNVAAARQAKRRTKARRRRASDRGVWSSRRRYLRPSSRSGRPHA